MNTCPFCGAAGMEVPAGGIECRNCHSISVVDVPDEQDLAAYYNDFNRDYDGGGGISIDMHLSRTHPKTLLRRITIQPS